MVSTNKKHKSSFQVHPIGNKPLNYKCFHYYSKETGSHPNVGAYFRQSILSISTPRFQQEHGPHSLAMKASEPH